MVLLKIKKKDNSKKAILPLALPKLNIPNEIGIINITKNIKDNAEKIVRISALSICQIKSSPLKL